MTIQIEQHGILDSILACLGKKRAVFIPKQTGLAGYRVAPRESFLRALLRPSGSKLPDGWTYWDDK